MARYEIVDESGEVMLSADLIDMTAQARNMSARDRGLHIVYALHRKGIRVRMREVDTVAAS